MQSTENVIVAGSSDKSLTECSTSSNISSNVKKTSPSLTTVKNRRNKKNLKTPSETPGGYDSFKHRDWFLYASKENAFSSQSTNDKGAKKKTSTKTKWLPVPIVPQPYKKREQGRHLYYNRKNESEHINGQEDGQGSVRGNNRFNHTLDHGHLHRHHSYLHSPSRHLRDETSKGELENGFPDLTNDPKIFFSNTYNVFKYDLIHTSLTDQDLEKAVREQIEYYFSNDNLMNDKFLRQNMDSQGYVPLTLISTFNRVKNLTKNMDTIISALKDSSKLELADDSKVRPVVEPLKWPMADNCIGLRTDAPEFFPGKPYINSIFEEMKNLNFTDANSDSSQNSDVLLSADKVGDDFFTDVNGEQAIGGIPFYTENVIPTEHVTHHENYYTVNSVVDPYVTYGIDYYSESPNRIDHGNGLY